MTPVQETEEGKIETPQIIDRAYGTSYTSLGQHFLVTPSRYGEGFFLATSPSVKNRMMPDFQKYMQERYERGEYDIPRRKRHLLTCDPKELREEFRKGIHAQKKTYKLWDEGPAGIDGYIGRMGMTAHVPSRRSGREAGVLSKWPVYFVSPLFKEGVGINYLGLSHVCEDFGFGVEKQASVICVHVAAAIKRAWVEQSDPSIPENRRRIKFVEPSGPVYLPFLIDDLRAMDIVFRRYVIREAMKEIDKRELDIQDNYDPQYLQDIENGNIVFEAIRQQKKKVKPKNEAEERTLKARVSAMESLRGDYLWNAFNRAGFRREGLYALELKGTPFETPCETYERNGIVVRPVFNMDLPPLLDVYRLSGERQVFYTPLKDHPFANIGREQEAVDDRTRRKGTRQIIVPGPDMIPELGSTFIHPIFRNDYRRLILEHYQGNKEELLRRLGLHRLM